ncbi:MAG: hypothetical protein U0S36_08080 [Candidatus Nanopelagicales bacterium]
MTSPEPDAAVVAPTRGQTFARGTLAGVAARGITLVGPLIVVPVALAYMGGDRYGLWVAITSLPAAALFADFGLGSGLLTTLTPLATAGDHRAARSVVTTGVLMSTAASAALGLVLLACAALWDPASALFPEASDGPVGGDVGFVLGVTAAVFLVNIPLSLVYRVQLAYQMLVASNAWQAAGTVAQVLGVLVAVRLDVGFRELVLISALTLPAVNLLNWLWFTLLRRRDLRLWRGRPHWATGTRLLRLGLSFFALSAVSAVALNLDLFLVAREASLGVSASFAVATRLMALPTIVIAAVSTAFWPVVGSALASRDWAWARRAVPRTSWQTVLAAVVSGAAITAVAPWLLPRWIPDQASAYPATALLLAFVVWIGAQAAAAPSLAVLNSLGRVAVQVVAFAVFLVVSIPIKVHVLDGGSADAVPLVNAAVYVLVFAPVVLITRRMLDNGDRSDRRGPDAAVKELS